MDEQTEQTATETICSVARILASSLLVFRNELIYNGYAEEQIDALEIAFLSTLQSGAAIAK